MAIEPDYLPVPDACTRCGRPEAEHTGWLAGGIPHVFHKPPQVPNPARVAQSFIETTWTCTLCGASQDVWGVADREWMDCGVCGKSSFVLFM